MIKALPPSPTLSRQQAIDTIRKIILGFFSDEDGTMTDTEKTLLSVNKAILNELAKLPPSPTPNAPKALDTDTQHAQGVESVGDDDFEKQIHAMFDHIWDCEIEHPVFQDTVGDLMNAVIKWHADMRGGTV